MNFMSEWRSTNFTYIPHKLWKNVVTTLKIEMEQVKSITRFNQVSSPETKVERNEEAHAEQPIDTDNILIDAVVVVSMFNRPQSS